MNFESSPYLLLPLLDDLEYLFDRLLDLESLVNKHEHHQQQRNQCQQAGNIRIGIVGRGV